MVSALTARPGRRLAAPVAVATALAVAAFGFLSPAANAASPDGSAVELLVRDAAGVALPVGALNPWNDAELSGYLVDSVEGSTSPAWGTPAGAIGEVPAIVKAGGEKPQATSDGSTSIKDAVVAYATTPRSGTAGGEAGVLSGTFDAQWAYLDGGEVSLASSFHELYTSGVLQAGTVYSLDYLSVGDFDYSGLSYPLVPDPATVVDGVGTPVASWLHFTVSVDGFTVVDPAETTVAITTVTGIPVSGFRQTIVATVADAAAGTVTFRDGDTVLGTATVHHGKAKLTVKLKAGARHLTARFIPEDVAAYWPSTSAVKTVSIYKLF